MMDEPLPEEFDIIIIGTGLPESVLSGALSRIDKKVLHIDSNEYYGSNWASFNIKSFDELMLTNTSPLTRKDVDLKEMLSENEEFLPINPRQCIRHAKSRCFLLPTETCKENLDDTSIVVTNNGGNASGNSKEQLSQDQTQTSAANSELNSVIEDESLPKCHDLSKCDAEDTTEKDTITEKDAEKKDKPPSSTSTPPVMSQELFYEQWRRFNIDLTSKVVFSRGQLVELLIQSNVCRYLEFRNITRTLTLLDGENQLQPVPCSRADVFKSKFVTVVEKRILMRVLTFCANYQQHPQEYEDFKDKPFCEFLQSKKLSKKAQQFIIHSIAMVKESALTMEGLSATQKFLQSLGRYGNSAFLFSMYGIGELPQAFSRLSAVFGGTFCLRRDAIGIIVDKETKECRGIIDSTGQKIRCKHLVLDEVNVPDIAQREFDEVVSRAIYVTDQSVLPSDTENVSLITFPPSVDKPSVRVVEAGPSCCVCPKTNYLLHAVAVSNHSHQSPEELFNSIENTLFSCSKSKEGGLFIFIVLHLKDNLQSNTCECCDYIYIVARSKPDGTSVNVGAETDKPSVMWSAYFDLLNGGTITEELPRNVYVMNGPGADLGFDMTMQQARNVFDEICPGEEFLPRAPEPEEIIFDEGYDTENNGTSPEVAGEYAEHEEDARHEIEEQGPTDTTKAEEEIAQSSAEPENNS